ncbi:MAG: helix-turn-helix transcriptional regulator [Deltaproteobacteria bacterium]|nr:helix-turn-helix transcriptional regulator [Deltaproteobacteria bacterium]
MSRRTDDRLTKRQTEVARLAARSLSDREIAKELGLSPHTVHTHLRNIFARLDISSREELTEILDYERD